VIVSPFCGVMTITTTHVSGSRQVCVEPLKPVSGAAEVQS